MFGYSGSHSELRYKLDFPCLGRSSNGTSMSEGYISRDALGDATRYHRSGLEPRSKITLLESHVRRAQKFSTIIRDTTQ